MKLPLLYGQGIEFSTHGDIFVSCCGVFRPYLLTYVTPCYKPSSVSGLDKEIQELIEAVVLPMTHKHMFDSIGIRPPKGILLHGPPGTGKTLLARACAKQTDAIFLKLAGPQLVQV